ncbi:MAG: hypothetical protein ABF893_09310, partial [Gluconacetobacter liquefaciens]
MNAWIFLENPLLILPEPNDGAARSTTENRAISRFSSTYFHMEKQDLIKASGGAEGNRTPDLLIANEALS